MTGSQRMIVEVCVESVAAAVEATAGGADRLELNYALALDGLTPSTGLFAQVHAATDLPIVVMIRPRAYGFVYSVPEFATMLADIDAFVDAGADGFAIGILTEEGEVDVPRLQQAVAHMQDIPCVFHRAFDVTPDPYQALETLIDCGVKRVLTSGQAPSALSGATVLQKLVTQADGRIEILPGAGITPDKVTKLVVQTGCTQVHGSFSNPIAKLLPEPKGLDVLRAPAKPGTDQHVVAALIRALHHAH